METEREYQGPEDADAGGLHQAEDVDVGVGELQPPQGEGATRAEVLDPQHQRRGACARPRETTGAYGRTTQVSNIQVRVL